MNDLREGKERVKAALDLATAPVRRLVYSTPQLVLASPFGMITDPAEIIHSLGRRLLQTGAA